MKRSFLHTIVGLTAAIVVASHCYGDSKLRIGGGSNRNQAGNSGFTGKGSNSSHNGSGNKSSTLSGGMSHFKLPKSGNSNLGNSNLGNLSGGSAANGNGTHSQSSSSGRLLGLQGKHQGSRHQLGGQHQPDGQHGFKVALPSSVQGKSRTQILLPNGTTKTPVALDAASVLKHKAHVNPIATQQIQHIVAGAPKHLCAKPHFKWWVNVCHSHNHTHYGCWNIHNHYWDAWTPCNLHVVQCGQLSYFVGLNCTYIPDTQAYGVQSVVNGSPAQLSGLQAGDLIVTVNGRSVIDPDLMNAELVNGRLDLVVIREGAPTPLTTTVIPRLVQTVSF